MWDEATLRHVFRICWEKARAGANDLPTWDVRIDQSDGRWIEDLKSLCPPQGADLAKYGEDSQIVRAARKILDDHAAADGTPTS